MRIVVTGGGTAGHIMPLVPIIEAARSEYFKQRQTLPKRLEPAALDIVFVGVLDEATKALFAAYDVRAVSIPAGKLRRYFSLRTLTDLFWRVPLGIILALGYLWWLMPDVVISKGGYGSLPVVLAAAFYRIPVLLHESDAVSGLANHWLLRFSAAIAVGFEGTRTMLPKKQLHKAFVTGIPIRRELSTVTLAEARQAFDLPDTLPILLVMGGSQGAQQINEVLLKVLPGLIVDMSIIHITGPTHFKAVSTVAQELLANSSGRDRYKAYPYLTKTMPHALTCADVVVCRAGATTLAELAALRKPALLIPLASAASDHQRRNAQLYERQGAARVLEPTNLNKGLFEHNVRALISDQALRQSLQQHLADLDYPQAAEHIAELTFKLATGFRPKKK